MANLPSAAASGHYARKQLLSRDALVAWSHARRFETGVALAQEFAGKRILDYGCGDGTFLAMTMMTAAAPAIAVGAELMQPAIDDCRERYRDESRLQFVRVSDLGAVEHQHGYDAVFCMEVLEHVVDCGPELSRFATLLAPGGKLIISVPVETGLPLLVKQTVRKIAGWRGIGHYPGTTSYSFGELASSVFAGATPHVARPVFRNDAGPFHDHKGFNWMVLRDQLSRHFTIERCLASPFAWLGPRLATQVWLIVAPRP
jgi:SAM-dependent methyltransferase